MVEKYNFMKQNLEFISAKSFLGWNWQPHVYKKSRKNQRWNVSSNDRRDPSYWFSFGRNSRKVILTAQLGSSANIVGERPRYIPFKPSVFIMFSRLVIMTPPDCCQKIRALKKNLAFWHMQKWETTKSLYARWVEKTSIHL